MNTFEKLCKWTRHAPGLEAADWIWDAARPFYESTLARLYRQGIERTINGSDRFLISPQARGISENYEPDVWKALMNELKTGDTFVDVGAFLGLYTIAIAVRQRGAGRIVAFEPDGRNFSWLQENVRLNQLEGQIELHQVAVSNKSGSANFLASGSSEAHLESDERSDAGSVDVVTLDDIFARDRVDVLKIDVEGYEEMVLLGAHNLLCSPERRPRAIFVEVHPYAWKSVGTTIESLLRLVSAVGYEAKTVQGAPLHTIDKYGEIVARPRFVQAEVRERAS